MSKSHKNNDWSIVFTAWRRQTWPRRETQDFDPRFLAAYKKAFRAGFKAGVRAEEIPCVEEGRKLRESLEKKP